MGEYVEKPYIIRMSEGKVFVNDIQYYPLPEKKIGSKGVLRNTLDLQDFEQIVRFETRMKYRYNQLTSSSQETAQLELANWLVTQPEVKSIKTFPEGVEIEYQKMFIITYFWTALEKDKNRDVRKKLGNLGYIEQLWSLKHSLKRGDLIIFGEGYRIMRPGQEGERIFRKIKEIIQSSQQPVADLARIIGCPESVAEDIHKNFNKGAPRSLHLKS